MTQQPEQIIPLCIGCNKRAEDLEEYRELAVAEGIDSPDQAVRDEEGTYNRKNGHFYCTTCYIRAGEPLGVAP